MISGQESLELLMADYAYFEDMSGSLRQLHDLPSNAYFSSALRDLFQSGVISSEMKSFLSKFDCETNPNTESEFFVDNIKHLTIANRYYGHALIEFAMVQMLTVFRNLKSIKFEKVDMENWEHLAKCAENLESFVTALFQILLL